MLIYISASPLGVAKLRVPDPATAARKYVDVTPARATYYEAGAKGKGAEWERGATAAAARFKAAVTAADIDKRFMGGVKGKASKFDRKVETVGVGRYAPGVQAAEDDYRTAVAPYLEELARVDVPERGPRGAPGNYDIVKRIGDALNKKRLALKAVS
jgi:hypothetical protein